MNPEIIPDLTGDQPQALHPWHKPEIQRLTVSLDTAAGGGSNVDGDGTFGPFGVVIISDARVRQDISGITDALGGILALNGVTYRYNTAAYPELGLSDQPQIGFLAQELEQVFPELVVTRNDGFKAVNYALLVPVLVEAIKQQQCMIAELQVQVKELQRS
jgi:hypothetical protein